MRKQFEIGLRIEFSLKRSKNGTEKVSIPSSSSLSGDLPPPGFCGKRSELVMHRSVPILTIPLGDPRDSHILVAPGVGFSLLCLARESAPGEVLNQNKSSIILKKSAIFALSLKQTNSSSFNMFIYAISEQSDLGPIYTITYQNL